ncbi:MAG: hypothetical protein H0T42_17125 [Deltaproteobacteria bacterium]|nr:hypothetical protein [Deltaproteobacteria bacterium]
MWRWLRTLFAPREAGPPSLRAVVAPLGDPYREDLGAKHMERTAEPCSLADIFAALQAARLAFRPRRHGFDLVASRTRVMKVRVPDTARIMPGDLACGSEAPELLLDLALAVVPLFGPLIADVRFAGTIFVDGTRDRRALGEEAAQRIQAIFRRLARRAPISFPILVDLARRMRHPS